MLATWSLVVGVVILFGAAFVTVLDGKRPTDGDATGGDATDRFGNMATKWLSVPAPGGVQRSRQLSPAPGRSSAHPPDARAVIRRTAE